MHLRYSCLALLIVAAIGLACAGCGDEAEPLALGADPPIAVVWAESHFVHVTAAGDVYVVRPGNASARLIHRWNNKQLDDGPYGAFDARWTPARDEVAISLALWTGDPSSRVAVATRDGKRVRPLTRGDDRRLIALSPDGTELIHGTFYSGGREIWSVPIRGGPSKLMPFVVRNDRLEQFEWSSDGRRVVASLYEGGLVTLDTRGRKLVHITHSDDSDPHWSPDGRSVLFTRMTCDEEGIDCESNVYVVSADGTDPHALTDDPYDSAIGWSPDGSKVLFLRAATETDGGGSELWAMTAGGEQQTRLAFNRPGWSVVTADWGRS